MNKLSVFLILASSLLGGCATIAGDKTQLLPIVSVPDEASVLVTDERGVNVFKGNTPTSVVLQKSDGSYWGKKSYTVKISKPGYATQMIPVTAHANGWYIGGNIIFGGLIGWFIVDPLNGAMYTLSPEKISAVMDEGTTHNNRGEDGSISIVLIQDVPPALREQMQRIN